ncbi:MAG: ABC transporter ATP-binding protein [Candidatus Acidiferrum sp.]
MSEIAIRAEGLSKKYRLGERERYSALRDVLTRTLRAPWKVFQRTPKEMFWALKDVDLEVKHGEVLGLIGRNGAGKTTLLKILCRITRPTSGWAEIYGRVGSLLEVGTGFHPELTGRENIYLSGAILGMGKSEINRKFDEIVAFSDLEKFLDMPVKHYSSGMYVRLAFAVAAHLEPEILFVDEVLAVGDVRFQKKCLGKMNDVARAGRTVILVSHNMGAITQLCGRCVLLEDGHVKAVGATQEMVNQYLLESGATSLAVSLSPERNVNSDAVITDCWIADEAGKPLSSIDVRNGWQLGIKVLVRRKADDIDVGIRVRNSMQIPLFTSNMRQSGIGDSFLQVGENSFFVAIPGHFLAPGSYLLTVGTHRPNVEALDFHEDILRFDVEESGSDMWQYRGSNFGNILVRFPWHKCSTDN